ncbi:DNA repair protein xrcc2 [Anaeramoeba ignava]|uniref:DNA repair protein xrcc2 n=1 Tax=Anaeramoeba ignava TaxID=1746090 RepID=A0A9Q0L7Y1_ANAIG|nr:DNA repair protein xrcc2 [Anaeramoeba ignava]
MIKNLIPKTNILELNNKWKQKQKFNSGISFLDSNSKFQIFKGEIIQIIGKHETGKTSLLIKIIAQCILPIELSGNEFNVCLFDNNFSFNINQLAKILLKRISIKFTNQEEINQILLKSLERLYIYQCKDILELIINLKWVVSLSKRQQKLNSKSTIQAIFIDDITSHFLEFKEELPQNIFNRRITQDLEVLSNDLKITIFIVQTIIYQSKTIEYQNQQLNENITQKTERIRKMLQSNSNLETQWDYLIKINIVLEKLFISEQENSQTDSTIREIGLISILSNLGYFMDFSFRIDSQEMIFDL